MENVHEKILDRLFKNFDKSKEHKILDAGSGETSLSFLINNFPSSKILAIIYPGDEKKRSDLSKIQNDNFTIQETDLRDFQQKERFDFILSHLFLGEATKFSKEPFEEMISSLFSIECDHLIIVDALTDPDVDYRQLLGAFSQKGDVRIVIREGDYVGFLLRKK